MVTDTALIEKRKELKDQLEMGKFKTLVDVVLEWIDRAVQKTTGNSKPLPIWLRVVFLSLAVGLIINGASYVTGDWTNFGKFAARFGYSLGTLSIISISLVVFTIVAVIIGNQLIDGIFIFWSTDILDATESVTSLQEFEDWLAKACNRRAHVFVIIFFGLLLGLLLVSIENSLLGVFIGYGSAFGIIIICMVGAAFFYQFSMFIILAAMLRRYDLKLFAADPASSVILSRLSHELGSFVFFIAVYSAIITLGFGVLRISQAGIFLVLFFWLPIIITFFLDQTSLSSIIHRAKWKTLHEIQTKVEKLQTARGFEDKETMDAINRLMDYHDRVKRTRNSAIDLGTTLSFINSLLLPLAGFILGNLNLVLPLFSRKP